MWIVDGGSQPWNLSSGVHWSAFDDEFSSAWKALGLKALPVTHLLMQREKDFALSQQFQFVTSEMKLCSWTNVLHNRRHVVFRSLALSLQISLAWKEIRELRLFFSYFRCAKKDLMFIILISLQNVRAQSIDINCIMKLKSANGRKVKLLAIRLDFRAWETPVAILSDYA